MVLPKAFLGVLALLRRLDVSSLPGAAVRCYGKTPLPAGSAGVPVICHPQHDKDLPAKQAQIGHG